MQIAYKEKLFRFWNEGYKSDMRNYNGLHD